MKKNVKSSIIDPIHGSIPVTELEYQILDTREFQRLRHVLQNSTAYQTYPSNNNTRFPHSLGVMHIAGQLVLNALANSSHDVLITILDELNEVISLVAENNPKLKRKSPKKIEKRLDSWIDKPSFVHKPKVGRQHKLRDSDFDNQDGQYRYSDYFLICTIYESVRIGALVHDIGHMPLSHIFESALELKKHSFDNKDTEVTKIVKRETETRAEIYKDSLILEQQKEQVSRIYGEGDDFEFHEFKGLYIFNNICDDILGKDDPYDVLITSVTREILLSIPVQVVNEVTQDNQMLSQGSFYKFWGLFHSFFANDFVDADRLDYTLRDPYSSGISFAELSLDLLYQNIVIYEFEEQKTNEKYLSIVWHTKAIPAIESFFHQRYLGYKSIAFHHSVIRTNAIAKEIIYGILMFSISKDPHNMTTVSESMKLYCPNAIDGEKLFSENRNCAIDFDDAWFRTLFTLQLETLNSISNVVENNEDLQYLKLLLETYLYRKSSYNCLSLWKSEAEFTSWHFDIFKECTGNNKVLFDQLDSELLQDYFEEYDPYIDIIVRRIAKRFEEDSEISKLKIKIITDTYRPKIFNLSKDDYPVVNVYSQNRIEEIPSSYLSSFTEIDRLSPKLNLFLLANDLKIVQKGAILKSVKDIVKEEFTKQINKFVVKLKKQIIPN